MTGSVSFSLAPNSALLHNAAHLSKVFHVASSCSCISHFDLQKYQIHIMFHQTKDV